MVTHSTEPGPGVRDVQVPIASSFLLGSKAGQEAWIEPIVDKVAKTISYRIRKGGTREEIATARKEPSWPGRQLPLLACQDTADARSDYCAS